MFLPSCQLVLAWVDDSGCLLRQAMANGIFRSTVNIPSTSATLQFCCSLWVEAEQLAHSVVLVVYPEWQ